MNRVLRTYRSYGFRRVIGASLRQIARLIDPHKPMDKCVAGTGHIDFIRMAVPGLLVNGNIEAFDYAFQRLPSDNPILEIGTFAGLSACVISYLLHRHGRTNSLICVDPWEWEGMTDEDEMLPGISHRDYMLHIRQQWLMHTIALCKKRPIPFAEKSDDFFDWLKKPISFSYIDGDHSLDQSRRDFLNVDRWLEVGGFILFDDTAHDAPFECVQLMPEVQATGRYELVSRSPNCLWRKLR